MKVIPKHAKSLYMEDYDVIYGNKPSDSIGIFLPEKTDAHVNMAIQSQADVSWKRAEKLLTSLSENENNQGFLLLHRSAYPAADIQLMHDLLFK